MNHPVEILALVVREVGLFTSLLGNAIINRTVTHGVSASDRELGKPFVYLAIPVILIFVWLALGPGLVNPAGVASFVRSSVVFTAALILFSVVLLVSGGSRTDVGRTYPLLNNEESDDAEE